MSPSSRRRPRSTRTCRPGPIGPRASLYLEDHVENDAAFADVVQTLTQSLAVYRSYPACDATYPRTIYLEKLVRYFEDSTLLATLIDPTTPPADPDRLTPDKRAMTDLGVTLFGLDQLLPEDGRIAATLSSWAHGEPKLRSGCALMNGDGRWVGARCRQKHRAACARGAVWTLTPRAVTYAQAGRACRASRRSRPLFGLPTSANSSAELRRLASGTTVWLHYRIGKATPAAP